jgi:hypothetical protein
MEKARQDAARKYSQPLIYMPTTAPFICDTCDCHVFHQYTMRIVGAIVEWINAAFIGQRAFLVPFIIQFPLHSQKKAYKDVRIQRGRFSL